MFHVMLHSEALTCTDVQFKDG